jgi:hypothetical protein
MKSSQLKIGDKIRIIAVPGEGIKDYYIHKHTIQTYKKIIARKRPVKRIDEYGQPWYEVKFRHKKYGWEYHSLVIFPSDTNWVKVKPRCH